MRTDTRILTAAELDQVSGGFACRTGMDGLTGWLRTKVVNVPPRPVGGSYGAGQFGADMAASVAGAKQV